MLRISQLHGFNALQSSAAAPTSAPNPDHAWRFYGVPASLEDYVGSADLTGAGNWATSTGISDNSVEMSAASEYLYRSGGIFSASEYTITGWFRPVHITTNAPNGVSKISILRIVNGSYYVELRVDHLDSPDQSQMQFVVDHDGTEESAGLGRIGITSPFSFFALRRDSGNNLKVFAAGSSMTHSDPAATDGADIYVNGFSTMQAVSGTPDDYLHIDELYQWDSALTDEQILWVYNGGIGRFVNGFGQFA